MGRCAIRVAASVALLAVAGCQSARLNISNLYGIAPLTAGDALEGDGLPRPLDLGRFRFADNGSAIPGSGEGPGGGSTALVMAMGDPTGFGRDRLKAVLVGQSDLVCAYNKAQIAGTADSVNFALGEAGTVLGAIGAIVTAAGPARALAGLSGLATATRTQVAEAFYQNAVKFAILQRITDLRAQRLDAINRFNGLGLRQYPVESMLADVREYHSTCSFFVGVDNLARSSEKTALPSITATPVPEPGPPPTATPVLVTGPARPRDHQAGPAPLPAGCPPFLELARLLRVPDARSTLSPGFAPAVRHRKEELRLVNPASPTQAADSRVDAAFCQALVNADRVPRTPVDSPEPGTGGPAGSRVPDPGTGGPGGPRR